MYSFTLVIKQYERKNPLLDDIRTIHSNNICLVAKNQKTGGLYIHKTGKIVKGKFFNTAGSNRYPILLANKEVHIEFTNFPHNPNIITDQIHKQDIITILNLKIND